VEWHSKFIGLNNKGRDGGTESIITRVGFIYWIASTLFLFRRFPSLSFSSWMVGNQLDQIIQVKARRLISMLMLTLELEMELELMQHAVGLACCVAARAGSGSFPFPPSIPSTQALSFSFSFWFWFSLRLRLRPGSFPLLTIFTCFPCTCTPYFTNTNKYTQHETQVPCRRRSPYAQRIQNKIQAGDSRA
jgi:hypothetical protein